MDYAVDVARLDLPLLLVLLVTSVSCQNVSRVAIRQGALSGFVDHAESGIGIHSFLGIPYAKPPIGRLRFQDPVLDLGWQGELNAGSFGPVCTQWDFRTQSVIGQEDCLTLNVYTAQLATGSQLDLLPVMFYVHGGSFDTGSGQQVGPAKLLSNGLMVLVTVNYRLNVLGFLSTNDSMAAGNYGLMDLVMALRWVRDNVHQFGGDPKRVTIVGQSAGSVLVTLLLMSPVAEGLFHGAIAQSGSALCSWAITKDPLDRAEQVASLLNCDVSTSEKMVECLRLKPAAEIVATTVQLTSENNFKIFNRPVVDRYSRSEPLLPDAPEVLLDKGNFSRVPLMTGVTENEGGIFILQALRIFANQMVNDPRFAENHILPLAIETLGAPKPNSTITVDKIKKVYFENVNFTSTKEFVPAFSEMLSDIGFFYAHNRFAKLYSKWSTVYTYVFEHHRGVSNYNDDNDQARENDPLMPFLNTAVLHCDELVYLFDLPGNNSSKLGEDQRVQDVMVQLWTTFAKYGTPNHPKSNGVLPLNHWSRYDAEGATYLRIGPYPHSAINFRKFQLDFYDNYFDQDYYVDCCEDRGFYDATWVLMAISAILAALIVVLVLFLVRNRQSRGYYSA